MKQTQNSFIIVESENGKRENKKEYDDMKQGRCSRAMEDGECFEQFEEVEECQEGESWAWQIQKCSYELMKKIRVSK